MPFAEMPQDPDEMDQVVAIRVGNCILVPSPDPDPFSTVTNAVMTALEYGIENDGGMSVSEVMILRRICGFVAKAIK